MDRTGVVICPAGEFLEATGKFEKKPGRKVSKHWSGKKEPLLCSKFQSTKRSKKIKPSTFRTRPLRGGVRKSHKSHRTQSFSSSGLYRVLKRLLHVSDGMDRHPSLRVVRRDYNLYQQALDNHTYRLEEDAPQFDWKVARYIAKCAVKFQTLRRSHAFNVFERVFTIGLLPALKFVSNTNGVHEGVSYACYTSLWTARPLPYSMRWNV